MWWEIVVVALGFFVLIGYLVSVAKQNAAERRANQLERDRLEALRKNVDQGVVK